MNRKTTLSAVAVVGAMAMALSACGGGGGSSASGGGKNGAVIVGTTDSVTSLDPAGSYDVGSQMIIQNIFQTLTTIPAGTHKAVPDAAKSCDFKDKTTYTCTMRDGLVFSNGDKLTSQDVKWSFDRLLGIASKTGPSSLFQNVKSVEAPDAKTVTFKLKAPDALLPMRLSHSGASIVDHKVFPKDKLLANDKIVGSGLYTLDKYTAKQQASLKANTKFKGVAKLHNKQVVVQYFSDGSAMKQAVEKGSVNVAYNTFSPTDIASLRKDSGKGVKVVNGTGSEKQYIVFNTTKKPLDKKAVRQAVAQLVDRKALAKNVFNDTVEPLYSPVGNGDPGHVETFKDKYGAEPDKAKAAKILKAAGIKTPVTLNLNYTPSHYGPAAADEFTELKRQLEAGGLFKVKLGDTEWEQYLKSALEDRSYPAFQIGWTRDLPDPDNDLYTFYGKQAVVFSGYKNDKVYKALDDEEATTDQAKRIADFKTVEKAAAEDVPVLPLYQSKLVAVTRDNVTGVDKALDPQYFRLNELTAK